MFVAMYSNQVVELWELLRRLMCQSNQPDNSPFSSALDSVGGRTIIFRFFIFLDSINAVKLLDIRA